ncbi:MAG: EAL domain-containing protein [Leptolyngbya sp. RL_3_1]|nr:EAL domain-containing protein [Leptolyngbya sp. RL_3_1]
MTTLLSRFRSRLKTIAGSGDLTLTIPHVVWATTGAIAASSVLTLGLCLAIQPWGGLELLELAVFDQWIRLQSDQQPASPTDSPLVVVKITEADLRRYGWPISDQLLADALRKIQASQPSVVGLDLYRDIPHPPGETALTTQLKAANLIAITDHGAGIPPPAAVKPEQVGFNDFTLDTDGILRRNLLFVASPEQGFFSLALRASLAHLALEGDRFRYTDDALFLGDIPLPRLQKRDGGYAHADTRGYQILLDYRPYGSIVQSITLGDLLDHPGRFDGFRHKIVLIGTFAPSLKDSVDTPYSAVQQETFQMTGVMVHALMIRQLLDLATGRRAPFRFWPQWAEWLWLWGWAVIGGSLAWACKRPLGLAGMGGLGLGMIGTSGWLLLTAHIWVPVASPALGFLGTLGLTMAYRLFYLTSRDPLTGLPNQEAFLKGLQRSRRRRLQSPLGVLILHLNPIQEQWAGPERVNHDFILQQLITRLRSRLPDSARLARVGRDEFAIALVNRPPVALTALADQIQADLAVPLKTEQRLIVPEAHIGIAMTQPEQIYKPENLLRDAYTAMYRAKTIGKARYQVFATGLADTEMQRLNQAEELRRGLAAREFMLYYQPIVALQTGQITGFESLIRWQHPQQGLVYPAQFIPLAEDTGLIVPLGWWICEQACHQARQWKQQFPAVSLGISINLSGRQFEQPNLVEELAAIIQKTGIEGLMLKLEITESMVMGDVEAAIDLMLRLRALGCRLSLDDFGTGYSSLSYLRRFPIDTLKIDQSFVRNMGQSSEDLAIVRTVVNLAHTLGMEVIAEGVEAPEDVAVLRSLGCEFGQGYFWAKPLSAQAASEYLQQHDQA